MSFENYSCRDISYHAFGDSKNVFYKIQDTIRKDIEVTKAAIKVFTGFGSFHLKRQKRSPSKEETKNSQTLTSVWTLEGFLLSLDVLKYTGVCCIFF
jgi:hypothetical protein